jgi:crotonobetainyl-CoA:carnitine CoA-transferase CaiB-like acyl-CoA transferase
MFMRQPYTGSQRWPHNLNDQPSLSRFSVPLLPQPELDKERVPCAPVLTVNEAMNHPHLNERKTVKWIDDPLLGKVAVPSVPVKFSSWPDRTAVRTARLGETTSARCTNCSG